MLCKMQLHEDAEPVCVAVAACKLCVKCWVYAQEGVWR
jgi:hypothetical protein